MESKGATLALLRWMRYASAVQEKLPEAVLDMRLKEAAEATEALDLDIDTQRAFILEGKL